MRIPFTPLVLLCAQCAGCSIWKLVHHWKRCCGAKATIVFDGDRGIRVVMTGPEARRLIEAGSRAVRCDKEECQFLDPAVDGNDLVQEALEIAFSYLQRPCRALSTIDRQEGLRLRKTYYRDALQAAEVVSCVLGDKAMVPSWRQLVDVVPWQMEVRAGSPDLHRSIARVSESRAFVVRVRACVGRCGVRLRTRFL